PSETSKRGKGAARNVQRSSDFHVFHVEPGPGDPESVFRVTRALVFRGESWQRSRLLWGHRDAVRVASKQQDRRPPAPQGPAAPAREGPRSGGGSPGENNVPAACPSCFSGFQRSA